MNTQSKIVSTLCAGLALASLFLNTASAQDMAAKLGNVSIVSVDRMVLTNTGSAYQVAVDITFQNQNADPLRFRNADLEVSLKTAHSDGTSELVDLGPSHIAEVVLPGGSAATPGAVTSTATVMLGSTNDATYAKLVQLFNAVGDPTNKPSLLLSGSSELNLKLPNGWVGQLGQRFQVDLTFTPTLQRKVLLN
jgi:hypothetical protein